MENSAIETAAAELSTADFSADLSSLSHAVDYLAKRITDKRNHIPIVGCILIEADPRGTITLTATDLDLMASLTLAASVDFPGAMAIDAQLLQTTLAKARKGSAEYVRFTESDGRATVKLGRNRFSMPLAKADDFPRLPFAEPLSRFALPAGQFLSDLAALAPCIAKEDQTRQFMCGARLAVDTLAGQDRLAMVATDGRRLAIASRALPSGAESLAESILPSKAVSAIVAAAKVAGHGDLIGIEAGAKMRFTLGCITITTKLIDRAYLDWQRPFASALAPIAAAPALFPELLPGAPVKAIEAIAKAAPGPVAWERTQNGFVGTVAGDDGLLFAAYEDLSGEPVKGYHFERTGEADAQAYLESLAVSRGLPSIAEIEARAAAINAEYGDHDLAAINRQRQFGKAESNGAKLITRGNHVIGLTISGQDNRSSWSEKVQCWETLSERTVWHEGGTEPIEGSYSILMPAEGPQIAWTAPHSIEGPDGNTYLVADNGSAIHMNKDQVRALIGESCFETMAITMPDGSSAFILQWLWDQGDTRFLTVRANGRTYPGAPYVTRAEIEAGPVVQDVAEIEAPAPSVEISAEPAPESAPEPVTLAETPAEPVTALCEAEAAEYGQAEAISELSAEFTAYVFGIFAGKLAAWLDGEIYTTVTADRCGWSRAVEKMRENLEIPTYTTTVDKSPDISVSVADDAAQPDCEPITVKSRNSTEPVTQESRDYAALVARIEALERQVAAPVDQVAPPVDQVTTPQPVESATPPIEAKRTPAHERAIRRAWAERKGQRAAQQVAAMYCRRMHEIGAERDKAQSALDTLRPQYENAAKARHAYLLEMNAASERERVTMSKRRRSSRLARYRGQQMATLAGMVNARDLKITAMQTAMADPTCPERPSDIARLIGERDAALREAARITPFSGEIERLKRLAIQNAGHMEALLSRAMRAETVLRMHSLEPLPPVVLPPEQVAA